jgi:hypothetical protein
LDHLDAALNIAARCGLTPLTMKTITTTVMGTTTNIAKTASLLTSGYLGFCSIVVLLSAASADGVRLFASGRDRA